MKYVKVLRVLKSGVEKNKEQSSQRGSHELHGLELLTLLVPIIVTTEVISNT